MNDFGNNVKGYMSPKLAARECMEKGGYSVAANAPIAVGELLVFWAGGIVTGQQLKELDPYQVSHSIQVEDDLFQVPFVHLDPADFINHSCSPNAGLNSPISLVALRPIATGEEICFDYATCDSQPYDEFDCMCGEPTCRHQITGSDWEIPELQVRYWGYFSPYLQRRIQKLQTANGHGHTPAKENGNGNGNGRHEHAYTPSLTTVIS